MSHLNVLAKINVHFVCVPNFPITVNCLFNARAFIIIFALGDYNKDFWRDNSNIFMIFNEARFAHNVVKKRLIQRLREYIKKCCV